MSGRIVPKSEGWRARSKTEVKIRSMWHIDQKENRALWSASALFNLTRH